MADTLTPVQKYDIADREFRKAKLALDVIKDTNSPAYKSALEKYNKAKQYKELTLAALKNPKGPEAAELKAREEAAVAEQAARKEYERGVALANTEEKQKTLLTKLEAERQRLVDRGESTTDIDVQITNLKNKLKKTTAQRETVPGAKRPAGVPADAQWNPKTKFWETKTDKWDANGKPDDAPPGARQIPSPSSEGGVAWSWDAKDTFKDGKQWMLNPKTGYYEWQETDTAKKLAKIPVNQQNDWLNKNTTGPDYKLEKPTTTTTTGAGTGTGRKPEPTPSPTPNLAGVRAANYGEQIPIVTPPSGKSDIGTLLKKSEFWYDLPDYIFEKIPELGDLLVKAVDEKWDEKKFLSSLQLTKWWQSNSAVFRDRIISKAKYDELKAQGVDVSKSEYGQYLRQKMADVKDRAKKLAGVTLTDEQAQQVVEKIYNGNLDDDPLAITRLLVPFISKVTDRYAGTDVTTYGGQALQNYQVLQAIAKSNGLTLKDILPQISAVTTGGDLEKAVLQGLASGDIDINRVAQNARMVAAQGQPQYVRDLLNQGYDLEQIYAPYKTAMASVLELNADQIDLNDPTLRGAINNKGDMNIFDFKNALRKDSRWQYTGAAKKEVADSVLKVLQDFGFQG